MPTGIIEINDAGIRAGLDGTVSEQSAGFAVLDGERLLVGEEAQRSARLLPRWTNNRFWNQLGMDPVPNGTAAIRHHADLAFAHLERVWQTIAATADSVVLAVPGFYSREQLGLLLGMAKECDIPVTGIADTSLLAAASDVARPNIIHLDIFLHRVTLTILKSDTSLRRSETITVSETGLFTLWDRWANIIASQFIQASRYDPMHQAVSEQKLYDLLPDWIAALGQSRTHAFELEIGGNRHQVAVSQEQLLTACSTIYPQIVQAIREHIPTGQPTTLLISDRFKGFPGLEDSLALINGTETIRLNPDSVHRGAISHLDKIVGGSGAVSHVTSLPISNPVTGRPDVGETRAPGNQPTHLLFRDTAYGIGSVLQVRGIEDGGLVLGEDGAVITLYKRGHETILENSAGSSVLLNDSEAPSHTTVLKGDRLEINGQRLILISVT